MKWKEKMNQLERKNRKKICGKNVEKTKRLKEYTSLKKGKKGFGETLEPEIDTKETEGRRKEGNEGEEGMKRGNKRKSERSKTRKD